MAKASSDQRFQAVLPIALMIVALVLSVLGALGVGSLLYTVGFVTFGAGLVLEVRRHNRNLFLTAAVVLALLIAYWVVGTEILKSTWRLGS